MTLAEAGTAFLNETMKASAGVSIRYEPKGGFAQTETGTNEPMTAWTGTPGQDETVSPNGSTAARAVIRERDYLIVMADLVNNGCAPPKEGDRITEEIGGMCYLFEVTKRGREPCWRWSDREKTRIRVHTKLVSTPEVI